MILLAGIYYPEGYKERNMNVWYSLILPLIMHLVICLHGIGDTFTACAKGMRHLNSPRTSQVRQRERELEMMGSGRRSGAYSADQMRYNRVMETQMRQIRSQTQGIRF